MLLTRAQVGVPHTEDCACCRPVGHVQGIGRRGEDFVIILDLAHLLGRDEVAVLPHGLAGLAATETNATADAVTQTDPMEELPRCA